MFGSKISSVVEGESKQSQESAEGELSTRENFPSQTWIAELHLDVARSYFHTGKDHKRE